MFFVDRVNGVAGVCLQRVTGDAIEYSKYSCSKDKDAVTE